MLGEFELAIVAWCFFALFCGGLIKGTLGVGTPLLTVPLMALVLPAHTAVAIMAIPVVIANLWQVSQAKQVAGVIRRFWPAFVAVLVGTYGGVSILAEIEEGTLLLMVGVVVMIFTVLQASSLTFELSASKEKPAGVFFGLLSGVIGGISSMFGPMLIIFLLSIRNLDKEAFVGAISFLYVGAVVPWAIFLYAFGVLDDRLLLLSTAAVIPVCMGLVVGQVLRQRVSEQRFYRLVLVVLMISGATMLWRALN